MLILWGDGGVVQPLETAKNQILLLVMTYDQYTLSHPSSKSSSENAMHRFPQEKKKTQQKEKGEFLTLIFMTSKTNEKVAHNR
ncbi:hypothetical protein CDAR_25741 [Caerostris darwini]|uniref:Uncharacterized protein n=1 Tax=Caerostris darwini TaxID=1538125 RepID=A0AAV4RW21_9ARAC|nr:hypothetical protein CDAR_25741 [Caerostris darwini]